MKKIIHVEMKFRWIIDWGYLRAAVRVEIAPSGQKVTLLPAAPPVPDHAILLFDKKGLKIREWSE